MTPAEAIAREQRLMEEISRAYDNLAPASECADLIAEIEKRPSLAAHPFVSRRIREIRDRVGGATS
jgi:hypothetical protein